VIYFCADDYGISKEYNRCIEECVEKKVLNKVSILPNGEIDDFVEKFSTKDVLLTLHLNVVEGRPLSPLEDIRLLCDEQGNFKHSFIGLFLMTFSPRRKVLERQMYTEIKNQLHFWMEKTGQKKVSVDCHQHVYEIPWIFKTLVKVFHDEKIEINYLRIPAEPLRSYLYTPSLYHSYSVTGFVKQWLLKVLAFINRRSLKGLSFRSAYFMGVMLSGKLTKERVQKLLKHYLYFSEKNKRDIEVAFHPGYVGKDLQLIDGSRKDFKKFYCSPWRMMEYETLMNDELLKMKKEGSNHAIS